jgi:hypothetical protein
MWKRLAKNPLATAYEELAGSDVLDLAPRLTLVLLIVYGGNYWYLRVPMTVACVCGLLTRSLSRSAGYWFALTAVMTWGNAVNWYAIDNHKYLMTYWCLALSMSLSAPDAAAVLRRNARLLVCLTFFFAVLWKGLLSPDYMNSTFFHYTLLSDRRFAGFAEHFGGMPPEWRQANQAALRELFALRAPSNVAQLHYPGRLVLLAALMTYGTILIEALVALAYSGPWLGPLYRHRHWLLLAFTAGTYAVAPVAGFGWVLMTLGYAQCEPGRRRTRVAYLAAFLLIQVYTAPWWRTILPSLAG